ncbi:MAG TPA: tetratricopeptide repeat protein [Longimicrobiales bacterium]|nr:tetratricopeptide repeat protein [Longimicrobiales bacterium]
MIPQRGARGEYQFSFQDIVLLRTASSLRSARVPRTRMERALACLKQQLPPEQPLSAVRIDACGDRIVVHDGERAWDLENDQLHLVFVDHPAEVRNLPEPAPPDRTEAESWYERGLEQETEAPEQARACYQRAVLLDPTHADAQVNLGRLLHTAGHIREAAERYRLALLHGPHATAAYNLGIALEDLHHHEEAMQAYRAALHMAPLLAEAHFNLARLCEVMGDSLSAIRHFKTYKQLTDSRPH